MLRLTLIGEKHLCERRHSNQEVQHSAAVGVVGAVVVRLDGRHGVVLTDALLVLLLQVLHEEHVSVFYLWNMQNARVARVETDTRTYPVIIHVAILFLFGLDSDGFAQVPALKYESKQLFSNDIISDRSVDFKETPVPF